jgi:hypothetical protein
MKKLMVVTVTSLVGLSLVLSLGCSKSSGGDPGEAMFAHMKAIFKLLKDHTGDCDKAVAEVTGYTEKHKAELSELKTKLEEMNKTMSAEDKAKYEEKMKKMAEEMMTTAMADMMEFGSKCPTHMQKVSEAMSFLEMK